MTADKDAEKEHLERRGLNPYDFTVLGPMAGSGSYPNVARYKQASPEQLDDIMKGLRSNKRVGQRPKPNDNFVRGPAVDAFDDMLLDKPSKQDVERWLKEGRFLVTQFKLFYIRQGKKAYDRFHARLEAWVQEQLNDV